MKYSNSLSQLQDDQRGLPWTIFFFLFIIIFFARPYELFIPPEVKEAMYSAPEVLVERLKHGNLPRRVALFSLGIFAIFSLIRKRLNRLRINGFLSWLIIFFLCWSVCSLIWADDVLLTLRRLVIFLLFSLGAFTVSMRFSLHEIVVFTFFGCALTLLIGTIDEIALGVFNPLEIEYRFAGAISFNSMGRNCAVLFFTSLIMANKVRHGKYLYHIVGTVALIFLILTKSRMAFTGAFISGFVYWILTSSKYKKISYTFLILFTGALLLLILSDDFINLGHKVALLGRDGSSIETLTGRIPLWKECIEYFSERFFLGYGYHAFWTPKHIYAIGASLGYSPSHSHCAYLEMVLGVGIIGAMAFVLIIAIGIVRSYQLLKNSDNINYLFMLCMLVFALWTGLLNSSIFYQSIPTFVIFTILARLAFIDERSSRKLRSVTVTGNSHKAHVK